MGNPNKPKQAAPKEPVKELVIEQVKEPVKEPVPVYVTKYTIKELAEAAKAAFGTEKVIVQAALKAAGKDAYSIEEATRIVTAFKNKEVSK